MIEYVIPQNPDHRILQRASNLLKNGELICFPTDTNWIIACDLYSKAGVDKLYKIKDATKDKHFSVLADSVSRVSDLAHISTQSYRIIKSCVPGHYTFIFEAQKKIVKVLKASKKDHEIGVRFPPSRLVQDLISIHGEVLLSTNINKKMLGIEDESIEIYPYLIHETLPSQIALVLDPGEYEFAGQSTILNLTDEDGVVIEREGAGDVSFLK